MVRDRLRRGDHSLRRFCHAYDGRGGRGERRARKGEGDGARWRCGGLVHENWGGMFHETVLTACGKGRFAVTIKEQRKARPAKVLSGGDGMPCEVYAVFPHIMPRTLRVSCGIMRRQVSRGRIAMPHPRC